MAAKELGISLDLIRILPTNSMTSPNSCMTGGSIATEYNCQVSDSSWYSSDLVISIKLWSIIFYYVLLNGMASSDADLV